jgi:hypothetical protein
MLAVVRRLPARAAAHSQFCGQWQASNNPTAACGRWRHKAALHRNAQFRDRYRRGEPITSSLVESAVIQAVSRRFVKRQQVAWRPAHAHGLLQVRTAVLNEQLRSCFERWYPALAADNQAHHLAT